MPLKLKALIFREAMKVQSVALAVIGVAIAAAWLLAHYQPHQQPRSDSEQSPASGLPHVERIVWSPSEDFRDFFTKGTLRGQQKQTPVILTNTVAENWRARSLWTPEYLSRAVPTLPSVHVSKQSKFLYFDKKNPLASSEHVEWQQPYPSQSIATSEFFAGLQSGSSHFYFSGAVERLANGALKKDIEPNDKLVLNAFSASGSKRLFADCARRTESGPDGNQLGSTASFPRQSTLFLQWMGGLNATATAHYDA